MTPREWMVRQAAVLRRWFRRHRAEPTPEKVTALATKFAEKHAAERLPRAA